MIIDAAEEIMAEKGLENSSISEIAEKANVIDSIIYHYFKNKEDLLFSIPGERMKDFLNDVSQQLQGIIDPVSQLSKLVWFHLNYNDNHPKLMRILLFDCYSNRNFYKHSTYQSVQKYSRIILSILDNGIQKSVFSPTINKRLARDIILGILNWETLSGLNKEIEKASSDFEQIMAFVSAMFNNNLFRSEAIESKPRRILKAAERVFARSGYHQAKVKEIANLASVSEGTIYEYFESKENLIFSISEERFKEQIKVLDEELFEIRDPLKKFARIIRYYFYLYLTNRDFLNIFLFLVEFNRRFYQSEAYKIFQQYTKILYPILDEGKEQGIFRPDINNRVFKNLLLGGFSHIALRWVILGQDTITDKMQEIEEVITLFSRALCICPGSV